MLNRYVHPPLKNLVDREKGQKLKRSWQGCDMSFVLEHRGKSVFAQPIHRAVLRDRRLNFAARGLFCFIWDLPAGWNVRVEHLATMGPDGRDGLRTIIRNLVKVGAVEYEAIRDLETGKMKGKKMIINTPDLWAIESPLKTDERQNRSSDEITEERLCRASDDPKLGHSSAKVLQGSKVLQAEAEDAQRAPARAAAKKIRVKRESGIVTWLEQDEAAAIKIEDQFQADDIMLAIKQLSAADKEPVPGLVLSKIESILRSRAAKIRQADSKEKDSLARAPDPLRKEKIAAARAALISTLL